MITLSLSNNQIFHKNFDYAKLIYIDVSLYKTPDKTPVDTGKLYNIDKENKTITIEKNEKNEKGEEIKIYKTYNETDFDTIQYNKADKDNNKFIFEPIPEDQEANTFFSTERFFNDYITNQNNFINKYVTLYKLIDNKIIPIPNGHGELTNVYPNNNILLIKNNDLNNRLIINKKKFDIIGYKKISSENATDESKTDSNNSSEGSTVPVAYSDSASVTTSSNTEDCKLEFAIKPCHDTELPYGTVDKFILQILYNNKEIAKSPLISRVNYESNEEYKRFMLFYNDKKHKLISDPEYFQNLLKTTQGGNKRKSKKLNRRKKHAAKKSRNRIP